ncbi:reducing polyketide synthase FUB1 [Cladorrhinum sp. PSN259]|nr:reducing polyketide synthase FUB1 [Cladorrhinum sp. PSN259]
MDNDSYRGLKQLLASRRLLWLYRTGGDPALELVVGFARCIRYERRDLGFTTIAVENIADPLSVASTALVIINAITLGSSAEDGATASSEEEYAERDGLICINRIIEADYVNDDVHRRSVRPPPEMQPLDPVRPVRLTIGSPGLLDTLQFVDDDLDTAEPLGSGEVEVDVRAVGMNLLDVATALAQVANESLGFECAGVVRRAGARSRFRPGDRIFAACFNAYRTIARTPDELAERMPSDMSFTAAAGLPISYAVCYHALFNVARVRPSGTVLVHHGARTVGHAAIRLAQYAGADVFTTVGTPDKRAFVAATFGLADDHILPSRDPAASSLALMRATCGLGVDVVLNSASGETLRAAWACLAPFSRFIELGDKDILDRASLPMAPFGRSATFARVDMLHMMRDNRPLTKSVLSEVRRLAELGVARIAQPLQVFGYSRIEAAFREMQTGKHIGKVIAVPDFGEAVPILPDTRPTWRFGPDATYVLAGGLGGLGRSMARWFARRGARHLILLSRSGAARTLIAELRALGCTVAAPACDVGNRDQLSAALAASLATMPPIRGCVQGAMVLRDHSFADMPLADFSEGFRPGCAGFPGQANYCAGNTYQDALVRYRISLGEKAVSINLGRILSVGFSAERPDVTKRLRARGYMPVRETEFLNVLAYHCDPTLLVSQGVDEPPWMWRPLFRTLYLLDSHHDRNHREPSSGGLEAEAVNLPLLLRGAASLADALTRKPARSLSMPASEIDPAKPPQAFGIDSLISVEIRSWLQKEIGAELRALELMGQMSIAQLGRLAATKSKYLPSFGSG